MARWRRWVSRRVAAGFVVALCLVVGTGVPAHAVAGATPNTITAFITAAYHDILDRAPTSSELSAGAQQVAAGHGAQFLAGLVTSGEWVAHIVDRFYTDTLGRPADSDGLAFWEHQIAAGTYTVEQAAAFFYASDEYFARVGQGNDWPWVGDLYTKLLGRAPDASGQTYWTTLAATKGRLFVAAAFYQSLESRQARVTALYLRLLQRFADGGGLDYWAGQVLNTGDLALAPSLATSDEYQVRAQTRTYAAPTETALADTARQPYVHQLTATGGTGPYTWSGTGLPAGLSIDATGLISGTPTAAGSTNPVFTIVDAFGTRTSTSVAMTIDPVGTPRITNALSVSVGGGQTCAVLATGHVVCWGYNRYGQVSGTDRNGTEAASPALVEVPGVGDATAVSAGGNHTCALLSTHHISCWGDNEYGQLGTTTNNGLQDTATPMPAEVPGIDNATQVSAGGFHTCALLTTGQVECWGYNYEGQLGTSTNTQTDTAIRLRFPCQQSTTPCK